MRRAIGLIAAFCFSSAALAADKKSPSKPSSPPPDVNAALPLPPLPGAIEPLALPLELPELKGSKLCVFKFVQRDATLKKSGLLPTTLAPETALANIEQSFLNVARLSPLLRDATLLPTESKCAVDDDSCLALLGSFSACENVLAGSATKVDNGYATSIRFVNVKKGQTVANASPDQVIQTKDPQQVAAWVEKQACKALQVNCMGEARVDLDLPTMQLFIDDKPFARTIAQPETLKLPVGPHTLVAAIGPRRSREVVLPIRLAKPKEVSFYVRQNARGEIDLRGRGEVLDMAGHPMVQESAHYEAASHWQRPTGLAIAGVGALVAGVGVYQGLHSKSLVNQASSNYRANGTYLPSDISTLDSAHSAASLGNVLTIAGAVAVAAGLVLSFAF